MSLQSLILDHRWEGEGICQSSHMGRVWFKNANKLGFLEQVRARPPMNLPNAHTNLAEPQKALTEAMHRIELVALSAVHAT